MKLRDNRGSITIFVLIGLLFMTGFLIILLGNNVNKSKVTKEQFNIMSSLYSHGDGDSNAYNRAYTAVRKNHEQILTASLEDSSIIELNKTFAKQIDNLKIYGNTNGVGDLVTDTSDENYGKYKIQLKITNDDGSLEKIIDIYSTNQLTSTGTYIDYNSQSVFKKKLSNGSITKKGTISLTDTINTCEDYTKIEILTDVTPSKIEVDYYGYTL